MASPLAIHIGKLDTDILVALADFICGDDKNRFPIYRSSFYLTSFFQNLNIDVTHDGSTRKVWVLAVLKQLQPSDIEKVILRLADPREYQGAGDNFKQAVQSMNEILIMENLAVGLDNSRPFIKRAEPLKFDEAEFLSKQFDDDIKIQELGFDPVTTNYIQPYHQMSHSFNPDQHTVDICWQVFKAAFDQLKAKQK